MKHRASLGALTGLALAAALAATQAPGHAAPADPMADITDVYAWMTGSNLNLVMDVSPRDDGSRGFGPGVVYVFHLTSKAGLGVETTGGTETRVICQFASSARVECWVTGAVGVKDYVRGDPSGTTGLVSGRGKLKVFAGRRSNPAFFNASGFAAAIAAYKAAAGSPPMQGDAAGCPTWLTGPQANALRTNLRTGPDAFAGTHVMAIVVQIDKSLVNVATNTAVAVWGATHAPG